MSSTPLYAAQAADASMEERKMKKAQDRRQESRTPTLDSYRTIYRYIPEQPEVRRIISRRRRTICVNLAARPGAKIDQLLP